MKWCHLSWATLLLRILGSVLFLARNWYENRTGTRLADICESFWYQTTGRAYQFLECVSLQLAPYTIADDNVLVDVSTLKTVVEQGRSFANSAYCSLKVFCTQQTFTVWHRMISAQYTHSVYSVSVKFLGLFRAPQNSQSRGHRACWGRRQSRITLEKKQSVQTRDVKNMFFCFWNISWNISVIF